MRFFVKGGKRIDYAKSETLFDKRQIKQMLLLNEAQRVRRG